MKKYGILSVSNTIFFLAGGDSYAISIFLIDVYQMRPSKNGRFFLT